MSKGKRSGFPAVHGAYSEIVRQLVEHFGYNTQIDLGNLSHSGKRAASALFEMVKPWAQIVEELQGHIVEFEVAPTNGIVTQHNILVSSLCPHHLMPVLYRVDLGYLPGETKVIGISKLARVATVLAQRPVLQEEYARDLADFLCSEGNEQYTRKPSRLPELPMLGSRGSAVRIEGLHTCMACRGAVAPTTSTASTELRGIFFGNESEFYQQIQLARAPKILGV